ncbi:DUF1800 domain-containing protein [Salipiger marinus]|uniref:DUF1800 domain-containing protein n=1 Tax=Salipiger marinus TaxID=555512 RepID=UPI004059F100
MAAFDPILADIRFGCGLSPRIAPPGEAKALLAQLDAPDKVAKQFPVEDFDTFLTRLQARLDFRAIRSKEKGSPAAENAIKQLKRLNKQARTAQMLWLRQQLARRVVTPAPFRERLTAFWADHFTATGKTGLLRFGSSPYVESALRPHLGGRFEDLLIAAVTHPLMVHYLDQTRSIGPSSPAAQAKKAKSGGLNENLAREVLELHTLGADGPYTQDDVRELAELLTGLTMTERQGQQFRKALAEPGRETVLGVAYGDGKGARLRDVHAVLRDLARHPATARHLARKLAVHFVSDTPDPALVTAVERAFLDSGTDLRAGYAALIGHPATWAAASPNVKPPLDFIGSALRALAVDPARLVKLDEKQGRQRVHYPMALMGHVWEEPDGPDGLPEADSAWISPQGLSARLQWAVAVPQQLMADLPDPRTFVEVALGPRVPPAVAFAARAAETRADGVGLVLASPAFQRM